MKLLFVCVHSAIIHDLRRKSLKTFSIREKKREHEGEVCVLFYLSRLSILAPSTLIPVCIRSGGWAKEKGREKVRGLKGMG